MVLKNDGKGKRSNPDLTLLKMPFVVSRLHRNKKNKKCLIQNIWTDSYQYFQHAVLSLLREFLLKQHSFLAPLYTLSNSSFNTVVRLTDST